MGQEMFRRRMGEFTKDKRLFDGFTPTFGLGCRRITPSDPYMPAIQEENVDFHFTAVESCTEEGVGGADGFEGKVDTIMCANGFDVTYRPQFPVVGNDGIDLQDMGRYVPSGILALRFQTFLTLRHSLDQRYVRTA